jgi:hypothetical protein
MGPGVQAVPSPFLLFRLDPSCVTSLQFTQKLESEPQNIECRMSNVEAKTSGNRLCDLIFDVSIFVIRMTIWVQPLAALGGRSLISFKRLRPLEIGHKGGRATRSRSLFGKLHEKVLEAQFQSMMINGLKLRL